MRNVLGKEGQERLEPVAEHVAEEDFVYLDCWRSGVYSGTCLAVQNVQQAEAKVAAVPLPEEWFDRLQEP